MSQSGTISPTALITNLHLKKVLKAYAANAMHSLSGPAGCFQAQQSESPSWKTTVATGGDQQQRRPSSVVSVASSTTGGLRAPQPPPSHHSRKATYCEKDFAPILTPFPIQPAPIFSQPDQTSSELTETFLESIRISCFTVGGEKRLCLPQILNTILIDKDLEDINTVCDDLGIYLPQCTNLQLHRLKDIKVLPTTAPSCSLITLTDAERLCGALLHRKPDQEFQIANRDKCRQMPVVHRCFGKVRGTCFVDLYRDVESPCIECTVCRGMFSPRHFVLHSDQVKSMESRLCHWGFESANWRHYVFIPEEIGQEAVQKSQPLLDELKRKFDSQLAVSGGGVGSTTGKRTKFGPNDEQSPFVGKRIKIEEAVYPHGGQYAGWYIPPMAGKNLEGNTTGLVATPNDLSLQFRQPYLTVHNVAVISSSAPLPAGQLNRGQPLVTSTGKVVFQSPFEKFSDKFAPNVALYSGGNQLPPQCPTPKPLDASTPRGLSRMGELPAASLVNSTGNVARERALSMSATPTAHHAPDRQRGSFLSESDVADVVMKTRRDEEQEEESSSSSNSTLSTDLVQERAILDEDEDDLNNVLTRVTDVDVRKRVACEVGRIKQRYGGMLLQAQHDKMKAEKELQQTRAVQQEQKAAIDELKSANAKLEAENGALLVKAAKRWSFSTNTNTAITVAASATNKTEPID